VVTRSGVTPVTNLADLRGPEFSPPKAGRNRHLRPIVIAT
jgi:hypothetical protein